MLACAFFLCRAKTGKCVKWKIGAEGTGRAHTTKTGAEEKQIM